MSAWRRWRLRSRCEHKIVRCVHGDEINSASGARAACLMCGQYLQGRPLPDPCTMTGESHGQG